MTNPSNPATRTSHAELILYRVNSTKLTTRILPPKAFEIASLANRNPAPAIRLRDATFKPSSIGAVHFDLRKVGINGALTATKKNAGKNIPIVAEIAPAWPAIKYPMNVAVVKTGPGVN